MLLVISCLLLLVNTASGADQWCKHSEKYLSGYSSGEHKYSSLSEAEEQCLNRIDCGGLTYEPNVSKYSLRRGIVLNQSTSSEVSYQLCSQGGADQWCKHSGKYLSGYSSGEHKYSSLSEAEEQCLNRIDCGGLTYEPNVSKYSLRRGIVLNQSPSSEVSYQLCSQADQRQECPSSHPYVYLNGNYCCKNDREKVYGPQGELCDGGTIGITSLCCKGDAQTRCTKPPCRSNGKAPAPRTEKEYSKYMADVLSIFSHPGA